MDSFKISLLLSFLSKGCVGKSLRSSAKAPLTFCCRNRSRWLVKAFLGWCKRPEGEDPRAWLPERGLGLSKGRPSGPDRGVDDEPDEPEGGGGGKGLAADLRETKVTDRH